MQLQFIILLYMYPKCVVDKTSFPIIKDMLNVALPLWSKATQNSSFTV